MRYTHTEWKSYQCYQASLVAHMVKNLPAMQETWVQSLGWEDPQGKGMATHFSILAWNISWTEEPGGLQFMGSQRAGHNWVTNTNVTRKTKENTVQNLRKQVQTEASSSDLSQLKPGYCHPLGRNGFWGFWLWQSESEDFIPMSYVILAIA